jgi:hypothetical protein
VEGLSTAETKECSRVIMFSPLFVFALMLLRMIMVVGYLEGVITGSASWEGLFFSHIANTIMEKYTLSFPSG